MGCGQTLNENLLEKSLAREYLQLAFFFQISKNIFFIVSNFFKIKALNFGGLVIDHYPQS